MAESLEETFDQIKSTQFYDFNKVDEENDIDNGYFEQENESCDPLHTSDYFDNMTLVADDIERFAINTSNLTRSSSVGDLNVCKLRSGRFYRKSYVAEHDNSADNTSQSDVAANNSAATTSNVMTKTIRATSKENISRLALPKRYGSEQNLSSNEYVPMAEAVNKFLHATPKRFRSKPNLAWESPKITHPQSPKLKTSIRSRPVYTLSQTEKEQLEIEDAKNSQFKANPLNKKIFKSPVVNNVKVKKPTIPEPFKLTAAPKKVGTSPVRKAPEFHARPVPKHLYEPQIPVIKAPLRPQVTKSQTSSFMTRQTHSSDKTLQNKNDTLQTQQQIQLKPTRPIPFSFEERDKLMLSKKEQLIQRVLEAEKRAREFHARPVPKSISQPAKTLSFRTGLQRSLDRTKADDTVNTTACFKAKPPSVLYKKPFEPKRENKPLIEIDDFVLNTDVRFRQREHFEQILKEKEERIMMLRRQDEMIQKQREEEEIRRARKNAEFKAQEIKKYKDVVIKPSMKLTQPISPKFLSNKTKNRSGNKENTP